MNPLLEASHLSKIYTTQFQHIHALDDVSLKVFPGETIGILGTSGSGKSTLAKILAGLETPSSGSIFFENKNLLKRDPHQEQDLRSKLQILLQNPSATLNPRMTVAEILVEPLEICGRQFNDKWIIELLSEVGLPPNFMNRLPHQLSGGERQRIAIARAIALRPKLMICDEPISSLDASIQSQIIALLIDLRKRFNLTYILISHNLPFLCTLSNHLLVLKEGHLIEEGSVEEISKSARDPYTRSLFETAHHFLL